MTKRFNNDLSEYTESEFLELLKETMTANEKDAITLVVWFGENISHPNGSGLITHPSMCGIEDTPEAMVAEIKRYYVEQGLPCFKE